MFDPSAERSGGANEQQAALDLLAELERNTPDDIRRQRTHFRVALKSKVLLTHGNASEQTRMRLQGVTSDLSEGGCRLLLPLPIMVGDVYRITFDRNTLDLPMTFARCVRCALLKEDAFEAGLRFFAPIWLPEHVAAEFAVRS